MDKEKIIKRLIELEENAKLRYIEAKLHFQECSQIRALFQEDVSTPSTEKGNSKKFVDPEYAAKVISKRWAHIEAKMPVALTTGT